MQTSYLFPCYQNKDCQQVACQPTSSRIFLFLGTFLGFFTALFGSILALFLGFFAALLGSILAFFLGFFAALFGFFATLLGSILALFLGFFAACLSFLASLCILKRCYANSKN